MRRSPSLQKTSMPKRQQPRAVRDLIDAACEAEERYGPDELERFARERCSHIGSLIILTPRLYSCSRCGKEVSADEAGRLFRGSPQD